MSRISCSCLPLPSKRDLRNCSCIHSRRSVRIFNRRALLLLPNLGSRCLHGRRLILAHPHLLRPSLNDLVWSAVLGSLGYCHSHRVSSASCPPCKPQIPTSSSLNTLALLGGGKSTLQDAGRRPLSLSLLWLSRRVSGSERSKVLTMFRVFDSDNWPDILDLPSPTLPRSKVDPIYETTAG